MENKKTLAFICNYQSLYGGNFIPSLLALEDYLKLREFNIIYIVPKEAKERYWLRYLEKIGCTVLFLDFTQKRRELIKNLDAIINNYKISVIHAHFVSTLSLEILSYFNKTTKILIHIHSDFRLGRKSLKEKISNIILYHLMANRVSFISVSKEFISFNPKRIKWIPNGLAMNRIPCVTNKSNDIRRENNIGDNDILIELFGWSPVIKGVDIAIKAVVDVNTKLDKKVFLAIICGIEYTKEKMKLFLIDKIGINVEFLDKFVVFLNPIENVFDYHTYSDILLSASRSEGFSYTVLEMLSLGKRCVISDIPGTSWANNYTTVKVFESENAEDCSRKIIDAINMQSLPNVNVQQSICGSYSIESWVRQIANCYGI